jgi:hypothetical protein
MATPNGAEFSDEDIIRFFTETMNNTYTDLRLSARVALVGVNSAFGSCLIMRLRCHDCMIAKIAIVPIINTIRIIAHLNRTITKRQTTL